MKLHVVISNLCISLTLVINLNNFAQYIMGLINSLTDVISMKHNIFCLVGLELGSLVNHT